jgi:hypothetical protein
LKNPGLLIFDHAPFQRFDSDGWKDLIVAGEWVLVTVFRNDKGNFTLTKEFSTGWWRSLAQ